MFFRALMLGLAVFAFASASFAQTSPGSYYAQQKLRLEMLEKQGKITPAQRQAMELKLLQQLAGGSRNNGPKTGMNPTPPVQGNALQGNANMAAAQQAAAQVQAEKSREALKRKADGKKSKKKGNKADDEDNKKDDEKKEDAKKGKKN